MADTLHTWHKLACPSCGGELFTQCIALQRSASGGLVPTAAGWKCDGCHLQADVQQMLRAAEIRRLRQQIAEQEAQLEAAEPVRDSASSSPTP